MARGRSRGRSRNAAVVWLVALAVVLAAVVIFGLIKLIGVFNSDVSGTTVRVPAINGLSEPQALQALREAGLVAHQAQRGYSDKVAKDHVYNQLPEAGLLVRPGRTVRYDVSLGKASFIVPDLTGKSLDEAADALRKSGLALGAVQRIIDRIHPAGKIVNQSPSLGEEFTSPVNVDVVVADTRDLPKVSMPDLYGQPLESAEEQLTRADLNLQLAVVEHVEDDNAAPGSVIAQKPAASDSVEMGSRVELQVAEPADVMHNPHKTITLRIPVPAGAAQQPVVIKVQDDLGERIDFSEDKKPGEIVERTVDVEGQAVVRIFVGDDKNPLREEHI